MTLAEIARVVRSKNAGPLTLTLDILVDDEASYRRLVECPALGAEAIAALYGERTEDVRVIPVPGALALKITLPRRVVAGSPGDRDVYGAQQHRPLLGIVL